MTRFSLTGTPTTAGERPVHELQESSPAFVGVPVRENRVMRLGFAVLT
jgi:hypothetical protein